MKQLITRIDDELHARLKAQAEAEGRSLNALVVEALERVVEPGLTPRQIAFRRAARLGLLVEVSPPEHVLPRDEVIEMTRGSGTAVSEALQADRDGRW